MGKSQKGLCLGIGKKQWAIFYNDNAPKQSNAAKNSLQDSMVTGKKKTGDGKLGPQDNTTLDKCC